MISQLSEFNQWSAIVINNEIVNYFLKIKKRKKNILLITLLTKIASKLIKFRTILYGE